jgi:hypothetical protein
MSRALILTSNLHRLWFELDLVGDDTPFFDKIGPANQLDLAIALVVMKQIIKADA